MTGVPDGHFYGYPADIRSSGSDIHRISDSEGLPSRMPCGGQTTHSASQRPDT